MIIIFWRLIKKFFFLVDEQLTLIKTQKKNKQQIKATSHRKNKILPKKHYKAATQKKTKILPNSAKTISRAQPPKRHFKTEPQCLFLFSQQTSCIWLYSFRILHPKILAFLWHQILQKDALINQPTNHSTNILSSQILQVPGHQSVPLYYWVINQGLSHKGFPYSTREDHT